MNHRAIAKADSGNVSSLVLQSGFTPLHYACKHGRASVVDLLCLHGAVIEAKDEVSFPIQACKSIDIHCGGRLECCDSVAYDD